MGVRQAVYRRYNETAGFFLRDLRGDTDVGKHKQMGPREYLAVMQQSKFCLAPSGMGFSTRMYQSIANPNLTLTPALTPTPTPTPTLPLPLPLPLALARYESIAQGCVPLIIQDEPVSNT
jgi:hypothetical protein